MPLRFRACDPKTEAAALAELLVRAFRSTGSTAPSLTTIISSSPHILEGDVVVADEGKDGGPLAAMAAAARLHMTLAGADVSCPGVTIVACAPEHRRKGAVDRLMRMLLKRSRAAGEALSALYPFSESYYARFGYARVDWPELFAVSPSQLPRSELRARVRRFDPASDLSGMMRCYDAWRRARTGPLVRTKAWWTARVVPKVQEGVVYVGKKGLIEGYALYAAVASSMIASELTVHELVAATTDARRGLLGFLSTLGDQYQRIHVALARGEGALTFVHGFDAKTTPLCLRHQVTATQLGGAMLRVVDVRRALAIHPGPARARVLGVVGVDLHDPVFADQRGAFDVTFAPGGATAKRGSKAKERLALDVGAFSQVYLGAVRARDLLAAGRAEGTEGAAALLDAAFAGPTPFWSELNGF